MMTSKNVIDKFLSEAPNLKATVSNDFGELSGEQLNRKSSPDRWGVEERIDHLVISYAEYLKNISKFNNDEISPGATRKVIQEEGKGYKY